jgi:carboxyl-terminal processing protease
VIDREGKKRPGVPKWEKPIVLLINDGVRSGKEIFAYAMKKSKRATLVGSTTAGEVAAGAGFPLSERDFPSPMARFCTLQSVEL